MTAKRREKMGRVLAFHKGFYPDWDAVEILRKDNERREVERRMKEQDNRKLLYVDPLDSRFSL